MGMGGWQKVWGHTVEAHGGQQGVRARVRAAGKALEGMTDRQIHRHTIHPL